MNGRARIVIIGGVVLLSTAFAVFLRVSGFPDNRALNRLVRIYFASWSDQDIETYEKCFFPDASVEFIDSSSKSHSFSLPMFIALQRKAHEMAPVPMKESATDVKIDAREDEARVMVRWELLKGDKSSIGTDIFSMEKRNGKWRIARLVFMND